MQEEELVYVLKMRDEATRVLKAAAKELQDTGQISKRTGEQLKFTATGFDTMGDKAVGTEKKVKGVREELARLVSGMAVLYGTKRYVTETLDEFSDFNSGLSDVRKTTGLTGADLDAMGGRLMTMSGELATSTERLTDFASTAGRAGITGRKEIEEFTQTAAEMQLALDGIDPEAFLRFIGNTSTPLENMKDLAAALNALDDTSKTSAERIQFLATDIAAAGSMFNLAGEDVLAWSTLLAETGVDAGIASSTILRMGQSIQKATAIGGEELTTMAQIAGMTGEQFTKLAEDDMATAINTIIAGLGKLDDKSRFGALELFELDQVQAQKAINPLIAKYERLVELRDQAFDTAGNTERFANEVSVQLEKYEAVRRQFDIALDNLQTEIGADFAEAVTPALIALTELIDLLREGYTALPEFAQSGVAIGTVLVPAFLGLTLVVGQSTLAIGFARKGIDALNISSNIAAAGGVTNLTKSLALQAGRYAMLAGAAGIMVGSLGLIAAGMYDTMNAEEALGVATEDLHQSTADLKDLLADDTATRSAIAQAVAMQEANLAQAKSSREAALAELEKRKAMADFADYDLKRRVTSSTKDSGDAAAAFRSADKRKEYGLQQAEMIRANQEVANAERQLEEAKKRLADSPTAVTNPGINLGGNVGGGGPKGGGPADRSADQRADAQRDRQIDLQMLREQIALVNDLATGEVDLTQAYQAQRAVRDAQGEAEISVLDSAIIAQAQMKAVIEETANLRSQTGDKNAELTAKETQAIMEKVAAEERLKQIEDQREAHRVAGIEIEAMRDELSLVGRTVNEREVELAVLDAITQAKIEGRVISAQELQDIREKVALEQTLRAQYQSAQAAQGSKDDAMTDRAMAEAVGADTLERRKRVAIIQAEASARRQNRDATLAEKAAAVEAAEAQWELDEANRRFNEQQQYRMAAFDAAADSMVGFVTGAKSAKEAVNGLIKSLIDLIIQYQILGPIRRSFEQGGGGGSLGFLSFLGFAKGGAFENGKVTPFATGGIVDKPTIFPMANGAGLMGEAGPEAIMPLTRDGQGRLGVRSSASSNGDVTMNVDIMVQVDGAQADGDPQEMGRIIGEAVEAKFAALITKESRPGGMLWRGM